MKDRALFDLAAEEQEIKDKIKKLETRQKSLKERIMKELLRREVKSITKIIGGTTRTITLVTPTTTVYDPDGFLHDLGPKKFQAISSRQLDKAKLLNAVQTGKVHGKILARNSEVRETSPYHRYTEGSDK